MKRKSSRRDFLQGRAAADAMADSLAGQPSPEAAAGQRSPIDPAALAGKSYQLQITRRAMACTFEVRLNAGQYEQATEIALATLDQVDELEDQISFFRESSELCEINRSAANEPVAIGPRLFELLELAMRLSDQTDGAFDLTATPLWEVWGFARREGAVPDDEALARAMQSVGSRLVELDKTRQTVSFRREGVRLNLGGIGKGYALDRCAQTLAEAGVDDYLIHGGNSSVLAGGSMAGTSQGKSAGYWEVGIRHPLRPDRRLAAVRLHNQALATSGSWAQHFMHEGRRLSHILDPRTGRPAEGVLSATAIAPTATLADAFSTAFYVMGFERAKAFCRDHPDIDAVLVCPIRHSGGIEIQTTLEEGKSKED